LTGTWYTQSKAAYSGGTFAVSGTAGSDATVTFSGTGISWIGVSSSVSGKAQVFLDGVLKTGVDSYSVNERDQRALYTVSGLAAGTHTLRIHVRGTKNSGSGGAWVWVDAFDVTGSAPAPT